MFGFLKKLFGSADLNKDGKVDAADAKVAVEAVKTEVKEVAVKTKTTVKKAASKAKAPRKPKSKA